MSEQARQALFISHASPEDNAFTLWLGAKLTALGYEVFADVLRLRGGDDWERILETAIREKAAKVLLAATPHGVQKQGVRNEITIATQTAKKIGDNQFIVPLRLAPFDTPLQIAHAQYIEFSKGWAQGLSELLALLEENKIPRAGGAANAGLWQGVQLKDARTVAATPERLLSNWLAVERRASSSVTSRAAYRSARRRRRSRSRRCRSPRSIAESFRSRPCISFRTISVPICRWNVWRSERPTTFSMRAGRICTSPRVTPAPNSPISCARALTAYF